MKRTMDTADAYINVCRELLFLHDPGIHEAMITLEKYWSSRLRTQMQALSSDKAKCVVDYLEKKAIAKMEEIVAVYSARRVVDAETEEDLHRDLSSIAATYGLVSAENRYNANPDYEGRSVMSAFKSYFRKACETNEFWQPAENMMRLRIAKDNADKAIEELFENASQAKRTEFNRQLVSYRQFGDFMSTQKKETSRLSGKVLGVKELQREASNLPISMSTKICVDNISHWIIRNREKDLEAQLTFEAYLHTAHRETPVEFVKRGPLLDLTRKMNELVGPPEMGE